jgi:hypothetical protein
VERTYLFKNRFNSIAHHEVIIGQLKKQFTQLFLVVFKQARIIVQLRHHLSEIVQCQLLGFGLKGNNKKVFIMMMMRKGLQRRKAVASDE